MRQALEAKNAEDEATINLLKESEMKIDHWREGLENSYQQKRVLKEAMKQLLETNTQMQDRVQHERSARRHLERDLMMREDRESEATQSKQEDGYESEFGTFEWGRRVQ